MIQINSGFLKTGYFWDSTEMQSIAFNFLSTIPSYLLNVSDIDNNFEDNSSLSILFTAPQEDVTRFLLLNPNEVKTYSGANAINPTLTNSVDYRVSFSDVINVTISEDSNGKIQLINHQGLTQSSPSLSILPNSSGDSEAEGDIVINYINPLYGNWSPGQAGYWLLMHELGHAVGGLNDIAATAQAGGDYDSQKYTMMSYVGYGNVVATGLQLFDIAALQDTYGTTNTTTRSGDTIYALGQGLGFYGAGADDAFIYTIWDGGGIDTIDASGFNVRAQIDLREGRFSSIGKDGFGNQWQTDSDPTTEEDPGNVAIAYGTKIENATGTNKDDSFILNKSDNTIDGRGGTDGVDYSHIITPINVKVTDTSMTAVGAGIGTDVLISIEKLIGGAGGNDVLDLSGLTSGVNVDLVAANDNNSNNLRIAA